MVCALLQHPISDFEGLISFLKWEQKKKKVKKNAKEKQRKERPEHGR